MTNPVQFPLTVFYDHSCALCRAEILNLRSRDQAGVLRLVDASDARNLAAAGVTAPSQQELMALLHARDAAGRWLVGVEVFEVIYAAAGMGWISRLLQVPPLRGLARWAYPHVANNRYRMLRWLASGVFGTAGTDADAAARKGEAVAAAARWQAQRCAEDEQGACRVDAAKDDRV